MVMKFKLQCDSNKTNHIHYKTFRAEFFKSMKMKIFSYIIPFSLVDVNGRFKHNCCPFCLCWTTYRYIPNLSIIMISLQIHRILDSHIDYNYFFLWRCDPTRVMAFSFARFLDHTQRRTTVSRTPLDEWVARRRDLYLTTHNTHNRQISMPPLGFKPTISAVERLQTARLRLRLHWSQNRHNTTVWKDSR